MSNSKNKALRLAFWQQNESLAEQMLNNPDWHEKDTQERTQVCELLGELSGLHILDMGAGVGRYTSEFAKRAQQVTAVDLKQEDLTKNQTRNQHYKNIDYLCADITTLDMSTQRYHLIFSSWLLMYLSNDEIQRLLQQCHAALPAGGKVFFRESCEVDYSGRSIAYLTIMAWLKTLFRLPLDKTVQPVKASFKDLIKWVCHYRCASPINYRKAHEYEALFEPYFKIDNTGYINAFAEHYNNQNQRYWLLSPKSIGDTDQDPI